MKIEQVHFHYSRLLRIFARVVAFMKFTDFLKRFGRSNGQAPSEANASEGTAAASEYARVEAFNRSLCDLLSRDIFIARSDYGSLVESYRETLQLFDTLERSGVLDEYVAKHGFDRADRCIP